MKQCIINTSDTDVIAEFIKSGYACYPVITSNRVSAPICAHSDVLYQKIDANTIIISACQIANKEMLERAGYNVMIYDNLNSGYKDECKLNFIINGTTIIHNPKTSAVNQLDIFNDYRKIEVRQGYTKCSTIAVNENAYITDDSNIYHRLIKNDIDCLLINKGEINLDGYDYGFIGGAAVKLDKNHILFLGDFKNKSDRLSVTNFLKKYDIEPLFIKNKQLNDIGSALIF